MPRFAFEGRFELVSGWSKVCPCPCAWQATAPPPAPAALGQPGKPVACLQGMRSELQPAQPQRTGWPTPSFSSATKKSVAGHTEPWLRKWSHLTLHLWTYAIYRGFVCVWWVHVVVVVPGPGSLHVNRHTRTQESAELDVGAAAAHLPGPARQAPARPVL